MEPIACSLSTDDYRARGAAVAQIADDALRSRDPRDGGARLTFTGGDATEARLRELIAAEAECCPFLRFELDRDGDTLTLDVTGPDEARPIIDELFA